MRFYKSFTVYSPAKTFRPLFNKLFLNKYDDNSNNNNCDDCLLSSIYCYRKMAGLYLKVLLQ